jgi:hypothetical protein
LLLRNNVSNGLVMARLTTMVSDTIINRRITSE